MTGTSEYYIPVKGKIDVDSELKKLAEEISYYRGFLDTVMKKLDNERFVRNAPPNVIEIERKKKADAELKIRSLEERRRELGS